MNGQRYGVESNDSVFVSLLSLQFQVTILTKTGPSGIIVFRVLIPYYEYLRPFLSLLNILPPYLHHSNLFAH